MTENVPSVPAWTPLPLTARAGHRLLQFLPQMWNALSLVIGGLITILTALSVEYLRRPRLSLSIEQPPLDLLAPGDATKMRRNLRLRLRNEPVHWVGRLIQRSAALQCRAEITFHHLNDAQRVFERTMPVRWVATPEPIPNQVVTPTGQVQFFIRDFSRAATESRVDVYPGEETLLDVAVRFDGEVDCYGWNNDSYFYGWRTPNWKLPPERYLVKVVITSSGQKCVGKFRLINNVDSYSDFRLTELLPEDRAKRF